jgi:hypothetical protein
MTRHAVPRNTLIAVDQNQASQFYDDPAGADVQRNGINSDNWQQEEYYPDDPN